MHDPGKSLDLNPRHVEFIDAYFRHGLNATRAYQEVYPDAQYNTARSGSARLMADEAIKAEVERRFEVQQMSRGEIESRLARRARATPEAFFKVVPTNTGVYFDLDLTSEEAQANHHLIKSLRWDKQGRPVVVFHDPQEAVLHLAKVRGMYADVTVNANVEVRQAAKDLEEMDEDELERAYNEL